MSATDAPTPARARIRVGNIHEDALLAPVSDGARTTYALLVCRQDSEGVVSVPLVDLARLRGRHPITIAKHIAALIAVGAIVLVAPGYRGHTAVYRVRRSMTPEEWTDAVKRRMRSAMASMRRRNDDARARRHAGQGRYGMFSASAKPKSLPNGRGVGRPPAGGADAVPGPLPGSDPRPEAHWYDSGYGPRTGTCVICGQSPLDWRHDPQHYTAEVLNGCAV